MSQLYRLGERQMALIVRALDQYKPDPDDMWEAADHESIYRSLTDTLASGCCDGPIIISDEPEDLIIL